jgi:hypothetical protein
MNLALENLMRAGVARIGQLLEVIGVSLVFNPMIFGASLFSVYLVTGVRTPQAYYAAPYVIAGSVSMAAKGGDLLHRKWDEYDAAERQSQAQPGAWRNPSIEVSKGSRTRVLIANVLAAIAIPVPVFFLSYRGSVENGKTKRRAFLQILPPLLITIFSAYAWLVR